MTPLSDHAIDLLRRGVRTVAQIARATGNSRQYVTYVAKRAGIAGPEIEKANDDHTRQLLKTGVKTMIHTFQTVHDLVQENWESELPDRVLEALRPLDGKMITTRILDKLPGGKEVWILERAYGMTHLKTREYYNNGGMSGISLYLGYREDSFPLDIKYLEEKNPAYFSGRKRRNHTRMEVMNTKAELEQMAAVMNRIEQAKAELQAAFDEFDKLTDYPEGRFNQDRLKLEKACGMRITPYHSGETRIDLKGRGQ